MGEIADEMINGKMCSYCGCYLEPNELVFLQGVKTKNRAKMPKDGSGMGAPVVCMGCN